MLLVSVIMPAYNAEKYISEAIESILNQTFKNYEFIILDDASTDDTWEIIKKYADKDKRIIPIKNKKNLYIAKSRNKGISLAKGKYIVWQDADDVSLSSRIKKLVEFMEANPDVGICGSHFQSFTDGKDIDVRKYATNDKTLRKNIFKYSPVAQPAAIVRKKCFDEMGLFDLKYPPAEDIDLSFRIGVKYKFANLPEALLRYREHPNSATHLKFRQQIKSTLEVRWKYAEGFGYTMRLSDKIAYVVTWFAQFLPLGITIGLFKLLRSTFSFKQVK